MRIIGNDPNKPRQTAAVASGTLPNGKPVVVNSDGTVSVVEESSYSESVSSGTVFNTSNTIRLAAGFDSVNNKVIIAYYDYGTTSGQAIVGTVSGDTISFGTQVQFENAAVEDLSISVDTANDRVVIFYRDNGNSNYGTAIVGTVSGTSISFGTPTVYSSYYSQYNSSVYDSTSGKVIVANRDGSVTDDGSAYVGTVSGTGISFGSAQTFDNGSVGRLALVYDASVDRVVVAYKTGGTVNTKVGTVSGSTISFGSIQDHGGANIDKVEATGDNNGTIFICYNSGNSGSQASAFLATIGTSSVTKGTTVNFDTEVPEMAPVYDPDFEKYVILYRINSPSNAGLYVVGSASGTTLTFETPVTYYNNNAEDVEIAFDSNSNKVVFVYRDSGDGGKGTARVFQNAGSLTNLTAENYIGMSGGVLEETDQSESVGSSTAFLSGETSATATTYDPSQDKIVVAYRDNGNFNYGTVAVGTVTGSSISFGTPVVFKTATVAVMQASYDSANNKIVIAYRDGGNSNYGTAIVGTVSGTSISFGSPVVFASSASSGFDIAFDSSTNQNVISYRNGSAAVILGTVSGTSISFGSATTVAGANGTNVAYDSTNNKVVLSLFANFGSPNDGIAYVGTVSGTSISFGSGVTYKTNVIGVTGCVFDASTGKIVVGYVDGATVDMRCKVGTVSGTSISFGSEINVGSSSSGGKGSLNLDTSVNKVVYSYRDGPSPYKGVLRAGAISGTSITFDTQFTFETGETTSISSGFDSTSRKMIISYGESGGAQYYGKSVAYQPAGSYQSRGEVADGGNAVVDVQGGISDIQENLTAGQSYYVQTDGTISTTAGDPSVFAGTAVSSTKLIVKG